VQVSFDVPPVNGKLYAIPIVGFLIRAVLLIPQFIALYVVMIGVLAVQLVLWAPTLFRGQYPPWGYSFVGGTLRWITNVNAYFFGFTDQYPPFGFEDRGSAYPVHVSFEIPPNNSQFFAVPLIGLLARFVMLIPHLVILYALEIVAGVIYIVAWVPVLASGHYPSWGYSLVGGYLRWFTRVYAFLFGLTDKYPPFQLGN
jgi:hypothetical protein